MDNLTEQEELEYLRLKKAKALSLQATQKDPTLLSNQIEPGTEPGQPSFMQGLGAGLTAQPGEGVGHFMGAALPSAAGFIMGGPIGAVIGETARQTAGAVTNPEETSKKSPLDIGANVVSAGLMPKAVDAVMPIASKALVGGLKLAGEAATTVGKKVIAPIMRATANVSKEAMDALIESPSKVLSYIGTNPAQIAEYGKAFQEAIRLNMDKAGELYDSIIKNQVRNSPLYTSDFVSELRRVMSGSIKSVRESFGYGLPNRVVDSQEAKIFNSIADNISQKLAKPTAEELYFLQKDLTNIITKNEGRPLAAAAGQLKTKLMDYMGKKIPEIGEANEIYSSAKILMEENRGILNAENPAEMIKNSILKLTTKGDKVTKALTTLEKPVSEKVTTPAVRQIIKKFDSIAEARKNLEGIMYGSAGKAFTPWVRESADTGAKAGAVAGVGYAVMHPYLLPLIPLLSPRVVAGIVSTSIKGSEKISSKFGEAVSKNVAKEYFPVIEGLAAGIGVNATTYFQELIANRKKHPTLSNDQIYHITEDNLTNEKEKSNIPTPEEIKAKYKSGELDKQTAADMLRTHHGFK